MTMPYIIPTKEQFRALRAMDQNIGPIEMINLLAYREDAVYPEGSTDEPCSGKDAYKRYMQTVQPFLEKVGGELVWQGSPKLMVIGPDDKDWDKAMIVRYPSIERFVAMNMDPGYIEIARHRTAALRDSRLIMTTAE